ncbi:type IV toxin-antitoxin system AbiEi family antitoxin domain-containing protein [Arthrobacter sp. H14]|uniref:type IV toxin-antitoxin system AbiEi family antitoxin domain-containing protein n=1 Tax=Arthrobacter sp. H14 TaxID=1312959 RepID=UPI000686850D|nr:type IV toxin-antitoxin system AbiEi family antitoxin domain-containing protein [Arthrobacter sp. H14]
MQRDIIKQAILDAWPQFDVVTATELSEAGIGEKLRRAAVRFGVIYRLRRGAYVRADLWHSCGARVQDLMRIRAHFLTTPHAGTYSHATAARLHGLHTWDIPSTIHLTQPFASTRSAHGPDTVTHQRTVIDCACSLESHRAAVIGDHALRKGADRTNIAAMLESMAGKRGIRKGRAVVDLSMPARSHQAKRAPDSSSIHLVYGCRSHRLNS